MTDAPHTPTPPQPSAEARNLVNAHGTRQYIAGCHKSQANDGKSIEARAALLAYIAGLEAQRDRLRDAINDVLAADLSSASHMNQACDAAGVTLDDLGGTMNAY